ncbi:MAG: 2-C-methyl-D-erythritol 4-phosphate cytidylyltransferase, partial [Thermoanaerobaculales bacterium]|nr:2-C-methyl-D-erythritol 4-phosphate cytidylyltransferase [Thermoanaerobaculales bacterium]
MNLAFVCVGAGRGVRFGGDKLAEMLGPRTVFATALDALSRAVPEALMVVVVAETHLEFWHENLAPDFPQARFVSGGDRRQDSVRAGVLYAAQAGAEVVAVHDAARPLVNPKDVDIVINAVGGAAGAILSARVSDTVKRVDGNDMVVDTLSRDRLRLALTPQVFQIATLMEVWQRTDLKRVWTDEAALLESAGIPVRSVLARHPNPKV